uniref:Glycoside hydrolase family 44 catalytic domain-containing protein n=1 Tax=Chlamydomonas euryale TaxID=1486919 RepID=A0A7R9VH57_9CHLO|mmetsp:Transcript_35267/g.104309  ORF Transcript_35267/g.104309 Transcript_35267/m.104309 type:complete len:1055 (+) Transcript_35267:224-3388(+)
MRRAHAPAWLLAAAVMMAVLEQQPATAQADGNVSIVYIDAAAARRSINPEIYGVAFATQADLADMNVPVNRRGGNTNSRYNWALNADNRAKDYYFRSIGFDSPMPAAEVFGFLQTCEAAGAAPMITMPLLDWVADLGPGRQTRGSYSIKKYGPQTDWDPWNPDLGNGVRSSDGSEITDNDPSDANRPSNIDFQRGFVQRVISAFGNSSAGGVPYWIMDNEFSLWHDTHRDVHPKGATMEEVRDKIIAHAAMVKQADPGAQIVAPEEWGWTGYFYSGFDAQWAAANGWGGAYPDRDAHNGTEYVPWLLSELAAHENSTGQRLLDVFSLHYYPQGGEFGDDVSVATQRKRNRSTRELWDKDYVSETWIAEPVALVPRMREWADTYYPGTRIGLTEYNWGAEQHMSGATAQADVFGILGREGMDLAARWTSPPRGSPVYDAIKMYRNYDGVGGTFGDVSVSVMSSVNADDMSVFAATRESDGALTVMTINKHLVGSRSVTMQLSNYAATLPIYGGAVQTWRLSGSSGIQRLADTGLYRDGGSFEAQLPAQSITLFVVPGAWTPAPPSPPSPPSPPPRPPFGRTAFVSSASASPSNAARPGVPVTISARADMVDGPPGSFLLDVEVHDVSGAMVKQEFKQSTASMGEFLSVEFDWLPSAAGTYTVKVGVFSAEWKTSWHWNDTAAVIKVSASGETSGSDGSGGVGDPQFQLSVSADPDQAIVDESITLTAAATLTGGQTGPVYLDVEVFDSDDSRVFQGFVELNFTSIGNEMSKAWTWTPSEEGIYRVAVGTFTTDWSSSWKWVVSAAVVEVRTSADAGGGGGGGGDSGGDASGPPEFASSVDISPGLQVLVGTWVTINASATQTSGPAGNYLIDVEVYDGADNKIFQEYTDLTFDATDSTRSAVWRWEPAASGTYTIIVAVFSVDWSSNWHWNANAAQVSVGESPDSGSVQPTWSSSGVVSPSGQVSAGTQVAIAVTIVHSGTCNDGLVDIEVYNSDGAQAFQRYASNVDFTQGDVTATVIWTPSSAGLYRVAVGVFTNSWADNLHWNNQVTTISVI